ncbi:MAG: GEVED domain-containing protein [Myxococcota bacterium]
MERAPHPRRQRDPAFIGTNPTDAENTQPDSTGNDDLDDQRRRGHDGPRDLLLRRQRQRFPVTSSGTGKLDVWVDWNKSGTSTGARMCSSAWRPAAAPIGLTVPTLTTFGTSYLRLRATASGVANATADATGGEAEDYQVILQGCGDHLVNALRRPSSRRRRLASGLGRRLLRDPPDRDRLCVHDPGQRVHLRHRQ